METFIDGLLNEQVKRKEIGISMQSEANVIENRGRMRSTKETMEEEIYREIQISLPISLILLWEARP